MIRYYRSTLMFRNFNGDNDVERRYAGVVMSLSAKEFQTYVVNISEDEKDSSGNCWQAWIVRTKFNPLLHINDRPYLDRNRTPGMVQEANVKKINIDFVQTIISVSS